jgi:valyl-tRNA synthetase
MDKKYDYKIAEHAIQRKWEEERTYAAENNPGPRYSIDTPPPTVSGSLHIGHIFSYTQTDIMARYQRMNGFSVFYPFGFDDNGLPTERFVEKKLNISALKMGRSAFIDACLQQTVEVEKQFKTLWQRMGLSVDWQQSYSTIDAQSRKISQNSFIILYKKGFVYRKNEPALYCTTCFTSVAQAELEDSERPSVFYDIIFTSDDHELVISTTRPELLSSCVALLYNPADERYQHLAGTMARVPFFGFTVPIVADENVVMDKGTGLVMASTFGDKTDIIWFKKFNFPYKPSLGRDGRWLASTGPLAGLKVAEARAKMVEILKDSGAIKGERPITHTVNIHERCKKEIEYLALPQWFLKILPFKDRFIELADMITWYPHFMKSRYINWVENISWDWGLSRQRFFGIPFPAWHCVDCGEILLAQEEQLPLDPQETPYQGACPVCGGSRIVPDMDVMDTWNTSSLTPYICSALYAQSATNVLSPDNNFIPMAMRPQAHDIIRTWAFYTIVKTWMHHQQIPWKSICISGHVLSGEGGKISKSRGNSSLEPEQLLATYPADVIRYWTASASLGHDVAFSEQQLAIGQKLIVKLWNAFSFIFEHTRDYQHRVEKEPEDTINAWIIQQIGTVYTKYSASFREYEISPALHEIERFFWHDLCDNYLELVKDRFFNPAAYSTALLDETRMTLYTIGLRVLQLYAPFLPHVTEVLYGHGYQKVVGSSSLHQTRFDSIQKVFHESEHADIMVSLLSLISTVRKLKSDHQLSLKVDLTTLTIAGNEVLVNRLRNEEKTIQGITRAKNIIYQSTHDASSYLEQREDGWHAFVIV